MSLTINEGVVVKAYLDNQEIRRFILDATVCTNFDYVSQKTRHIFQFPAHQELRFSWKGEFPNLIGLNERNIYLNQTLKTFFALEQCYSCYCGYLIYLKFLELPDETGSLLNHGLY